MTKPSVKATVIPRICQNCIHWKAPLAANIQLANRITELLGSNMGKRLGLASIDRLKDEAEGLLKGFCTFDPNWVEAAHNHYCGQWGKR